MNRSPLQELFHKFDGTGTGGDRRLAYYGQRRAAGFDHDAAIQATFEEFRDWCLEFWPKRGIEIPGSILDRD